MYAQHSMLVKVKEEEERPREGCFEEEGSVDFLAQDSSFFLSSSSPTGTSLKEPHVALGPLCSWKLLPRGREFP